MRLIMTPRRFQLTFLEEYLTRNHKPFFTRAWLERRYFAEALEEPERFSNILKAFFSKDPDEMLQARNNAIRPHCGWQFYVTSNPVTRFYVKLKSTD